ncbi:MAG: APC family permease [Acidimicrobiia bacterium]|nr:APC family permease [Acidimicrobiia bacterium]
MVSSLKRIVVGKPIASSEEQHQRLGIPTALAVFASDAISSTAYATEEILVVLLGATAFPGSHKYLVPLAIAAVILLTIVATSYRQTIFAYPDGGGAYVVSRENISANVALVAGASLLVDYTLTVAVSIASGVLAISSAVPALRPEGYRILLCLFFLILLTLGNLRGVKESGRIFAVPTYAYVVLLGSMIIVGLVRVFGFHLGAIPGGHAAVQDYLNGKHVTQSIALFALLKAFSSGAVVLSGVEAISNGVPAFHKPESKNAARTLALMATILGTSFLGISILAHHLQPVVREDGETVLSQMGKAVFGDGNPIYFALQIATFAILVLAANTAFADFPRLSSIIARDRYMPRQLANRGDRLVFSNGVLVLSGFAAVLIIAFRAEVTLLIPLYAVGVFTGFTLSQFGMCRHHLSLREPNWQRGLAINMVGCIATGIVLIVVVVSKFTAGAWIPVIVIPFIVVIFRAIHSHYERVDRILAAPDEYKVRRRTHTVVVLVGRVHKGVLEALGYARSLRPDRLIAVSVVSNAEEQERIVGEWEKREIPVELRTVYSPYRELQRSVMRFVDELDDEHPDDFLTIVLPEFILDHWWEKALHNQSAFILRARLRARPNTVVTSLPFHIAENDTVVLGTAESDPIRP